jgi:hypothetical protein
MNQRLTDVPLPTGPQYWRRLDKIRPGSNNMENMIHSGYFIRTPRVLETMRHIVRMCGKQGGAA